MDLFLSPEELHRLTGYKSAGWQRRWLKANRWRFDEDRLGRPIVARAYPSSTRSITGWGMTKPQQKERQRSSKLLTEAVRLSKKHDTPYVFAARSGAPYSDSGFKANWSKIMADFVANGGERFTAHNLRAMYVTEMVSRNANPETHKNAATTRRVYDRRREVKVKPTF
ncbi:DUF4224 domain-containing protein [Achromobacter spanius]|uniref:DUF4224 domain-containing protein n=1 Tax=Achromobacter spanius TaxID=217203 RepID=A0AA42S6L5_9BURK|nr:DUF4224 domain-containing protein [Achromobacter spanius]MDH0739792.1 DUF4224 domain-containing protein [Achromobacter spanius]